MAPRPSWSLPNHRLQLTGDARGFRSPRPHLHPAGGRQLSRITFDRMSNSAPAYIIARVKVTDWPRYRRYMEITPGIIESFGGRFAARGENLATLEGVEEQDRLVILEFPTREQAEAFYHSEAYAETKKLRDGAAEAQFVVVDGCGLTNGYS